MLVVTCIYFTLTKVDLIMCIDSLLIALSNIVIIVKKHYVWGSLPWTISL